MQYRIVGKDAFLLVGRRTRIPLVHQGLNPAMVEFEESITDADRERIEALSDQDPSGLLAVCTGFEESRDEGTMFDYYTAVATSRPSPDDLDVLEVPAATWAVFSSSGPFPAALQQLWPQAFGEWLPANPYQLAPGPEIVRATLDDTGAHANAELWLPVQRTG